MDDARKARLVANLAKDRNVKDCCKQIENLSGPYETENPECVIYRCEVCQCRKWVLDGQKAFGDALSLTSGTIGEKS